MIENFYIVAKRLSEEIEKILMYEEDGDDPGANRISLILSCPHRPGSLHHILGEFASLNLNLLRLESHPIVGRDFEFSFSMDIEAQSADERVRDMLISLSKECPFFLYLGNYMEI